MSLTDIKGILGSCISVASEMSSRNFQLRVSGTICDIFPVSSTKKDKGDVVLSIPLL